MTGTSAILRKVGWMTGGIKEQRSKYKKETE